MKNSIKNTGVTVILFVCLGISGSMFAAAREEIKESKEAKKEAKVVVAETVEAGEAPATTCTVCYGEIDPEDRMTLERCGHLVPYCKNCQKWLVSAAVENKKLSTLRCREKIKGEDRECDIEYSDNDIKQMTADDPSLFEGVQKVREEIEAPKARLRALPPRRLTVDEKERLGPLLGTEIKPCSYCSTYIRKIRGCDIMTCPQCDGVFCWICGTKLPRAEQHEHLKHCPGENAWW